MNGVNVSSWSLPESGIQFFKRNDPCSIICDEDKVKTDKQATRPFAFARDFKMTRPKDR